MGDKDELVGLIKVDYYLAYHCWAANAFTNLLGWSESRSRTWFIERCGPGFLVNFHEPVLVSVAGSVIAELEAITIYDLSEAEDKYNNLITIIDESRQGAHRHIHSQIAPLVLTDFAAAQQIVVPILQEDARSPLPDRRLLGKMLLGLNETQLRATIVTWAIAQDMKNDLIDWSRVKARIESELGYVIASKAAASRIVISNRTLLIQMRDRLVSSFSAIDELDSIAEVVHDIDTWLRCIE